jgi:L-threonylcarbamoyladenylate synthase
LPATRVETRLTRSPQGAARILREGGRVVFPTETVYGLGADAFDAGAVRGIFEAKGRPADNPLIVHVAGAGRVERVARAVPPGAERLAERFWPGPLTLVLPRRPDLPEGVTAGLDTVGVRVPRLPLARRFLETCATPVAAPSANRSGRPSPTTWQAARDDLAGRVECILQGPPTEAGLESTVLDCTDPGALRVLRAGATTLEALREAVGPGATVAAPAAPEAGDEAASNAPRSPGTRHRHYAPEARVVVVEEPPDTSENGEAAYIGLRAPAAPDAFARTRACENVEAYARALFAFFRDADAAGARVIYAQRVPAEGLGRALMDRLRRASAATDDAPRS